MQGFGVGILNVLFIWLQIYYIRKIAKESRNLANDTIKLIDSYNIVSLKKGKNLEKDNVIDDKIDNLVLGYTKCKNECKELSIMSIILGISVIVTLYLKMNNEITLKICSAMYIIIVAVTNRFVFEMLTSYKRDFLALENLRNLLKEQIKTFKKMEGIKDE